MLTHIFHNTMHNMYLLYIVSFILFLSPTLQNKSEWQTTHEAGMSIQSRNTGTLYHIFLSMRLYAESY